MTTTFALPTTTTRLGTTRAARTIFYVRDFAGALAFYGDVLGLPFAYPADLDGGWAEFDLGNFAFCLHSTTDAIPAEARKTTHFALAVEDLDLAIAFLREQGIEVGKPFSPCGSLRVAQFHDPEGNVLSLEGK